MQPSNPDNPIPVEGEEVVPPEDTSGRERMAKNIIIGWLAQFFFIIGGFVLPRLINDKIGQAGLGVWDFAWSLTALFGVLQAGVVSSINRFVAKHRAQNDIDGISCAVSSVTLVLGLMSLLIFSVALTVAFFVPHYLETQLGGLADQARWVILLLGTTFAIQVATSGYGGVITGHHRWDIQSGIHAGVYFTQFVAMITVVLSGGGLVAMATIVIVCETLGRIVRAVCAYRICPGLQVRFSHVRRDMMSRMVAFGGKSLIPDIGGLLEYQIINILITMCLGAPMLALYSRPQGLIRHASLLVERFSNVLTPTASSLKATQSNSALRDLLTKATRIGMYLALPMVLGLVIMGDILLHLWMGPTYSTSSMWMLLIVLSVGNLAMMVQLPIRNILYGLNAHGRPGIANFFAALLGSGGAAVALLFYDKGLIGAGIAVTVPMTLVNSIYVPVYACRLLKMDILAYAYSTIRGPVLCAIPFSACLICARILFAHSPLIALLTGSAAGGLVLLLLYWRNVIPQKIKVMVASCFAFVWGRFCRFAPIRIVMSSLSRLLIRNTH